FLACLSSSLVTLTICCHKILRTKEYAFLAGLAASDFIRGYGYLHGGIVRMLFLCHGVENTLVTSHDCLLQIYSSAMMYGQQASSAMILVLSMDRYSMWTIAAIHTFCLVMTGMAWIITFCFMPLIMIA
uniref:G-protein coupled receptors family 1 profile domain-containing protein n=1 Tax=Romanomermis culicivorax TaxID=13658 RepID=A0A915HEP8_ROMCU